MDNHPMTHTQIATQAAEAVLIQLQKEWKLESKVWPARTPEEVIAQLSPLILSAAAKMVRESGAVEALERNTGRLAFMAGAFGHQLRQEDKLANTAAFADARAALQSLRSITGEAPQGDS